MASIESRGSVAKPSVCRLHFAEKRDTLSFGVDNWGRDAKHSSAHLISPIQNPPCVRMPATDSHVGESSLGHPSRILNSRSPFFRSSAMPYSLVVSGEWSSAILVDCDLSGRSRHRRGRWYWQRQKLSRAVGRRAIPRGGAGCRRHRPRGPVVDRDQAAVAPAIW